MDDDYQYGADIVNHARQIVAPVLTAAGQAVSREGAKFVSSAISNSMRSFYNNRESNEFWKAQYHRNRPYISQQRKFLAKLAQRRRREKDDFLAIAAAEADDLEASPGEDLSGHVYNIARPVRNTGNLFWWGEGNLKYHDNNNYTTMNTGVDWLVQKGIDIPQGTGYDKRNGLKVHIKNICVRGNIRVSCGFEQGAQTWANCSPSFARVYIVLDEQPNGTTATVADIFTNTTDNTYNTSHRLLENSERFKILGQHEIKIPVLFFQHPNDTDLDAVYVKGEAPFMVMLNVDLKSRYEDGTTAPPITNNILIVYELDPVYTKGDTTSGPNGSAATYIRGCSRVRFTSY